MAPHSPPQTAGEWTQSKLSAYGMTNDKDRRGGHIFYPPMDRVPGVPCSRTKATCLDRPPGWRNIQHARPRCGGKPDIHGRLSSKTRTTFINANLYRTNPFGLITPIPSFSISSVGHSWAGMIPKIYKGQGALSSLRFDKDASKPIRAENPSIPTLLNGRADFQ